MPHRSALPVGGAVAGADWLEVCVGGLALSVDVIGSFVVSVGVGAAFEVSVGAGVDSVVDSVVSVVSEDSVLVVEEFEVVVPAAALGQGAGEFAGVVWALATPAGPASRVVTIARAQSPAIAGLP